MKSCEIKTLVEYDSWAFERVWDCISQLSDAQFAEEIDYSTGSIRNNVVHMMNASRNWISRLKGGEILPRLIFEDFITLLQTKAKWDQVQTECLAYINTLNEEQLDETIHWELPARGLKLSNLRWEILLHVLNHWTDHRAQLLAILHHHFHVKTVEQDLIRLTKEYILIAATSIRLANLTCLLGCDTLSQQLILSVLIQRS